MAHLSMLNRSRIHSSKSVRGWGLILTGCIFDGQVRRGELNGVVLVNYLHQVVGRINRYNWHAPEECYETVVGATCPTEGKKRTQFQLAARDEVVAAHHRLLNDRPLDCEDCLDVSNSSLLGIRTCCMLCPFASNNGTVCDNVPNEDVMSVTQIDSDYT